MKRRTKGLLRAAKLAGSPFIATASLLNAYLLRFEFSLPPAEQQHLLWSLGTFIPIKVLVFYLFGLHRSPWRTAGVYDLFRLLLANLTGSLCAGLATYAVIGPSFPRSIYILDAILCFLISGAMQFGERMVREVLLSETRVGSKAKSILIYGAGSAGLTLAKEIRTNSKLGMRVVGFLDDDPGKRGATLAGVPILGDGRQAARIVTRFERKRNPISTIVIAMPSATGRQMRTAVANCRAAGVQTRTVPGLEELLNQPVSTGQLREVSVNDLLGREPVQIDQSSIANEIQGKSVLVTGGCGSIGSELCRQLARFHPGKLVMFDRAESDLFMLGIELRHRFADLHLVEEIGDICSRARVDEVISRHRIDAVFHAAAYKHVPMMEANVLEAAANNVIGTWNVAQSAYHHRVGKFLMISSDKAVNPSSIMGVTKRIAELLVAAMRTEGDSNNTSFVSVRFGNVLGSNGSVVPIFQRQIAGGGPVTITHKDMRRYFMSIPEAVLLILQAFAMGKGKEIFVLDMGEPVRIMDLAQNMIRLAGLVPNEDIEIRVTGTRPGEKLFEELRTDSDHTLPTYHSKIKIFRSQDPGRDLLFDWVQELKILLEGRQSAEVRGHLLKLVPEYCGHLTLEATVGGRSMPGARENAGLIASY